MFNRLCFSVVSDMSFANNRGQGRDYIHGTRRLLAIDSIASYQNTYGDTAIFQAKYIVTIISIG